MFGSGTQQALPPGLLAAGDGMPEPSAPSISSSDPLPTAELAGWVGALRRLVADVGDAERIDQLRLLEELKSAAAAAQAVVTAAFARSQRTVNGVPAGGVPGAMSASEREQRRRRAADATRSIRAQVALARKEAPRAGGRHLGLAEVLTYEMPRTLAALAEGTLSEWRATLICRETAGLSREHRAVVDTELEGQLAGAGDRRVAQLARSAAYRLDPQAVVSRSARAASDRRVTIRPAPDTMTYVSALLPVEAGVAVYAALSRDADAAIASGDDRGRGQVMADRLVDCVLHPGVGGGADDPVAAVRAAYARAGSRGQKPSERSRGSIDPGGRARPPRAEGIPPGVGLDIGLIVTDQTLFGGDDEPALLGGEVIPAALARGLVASLPASSKAWVRRLYTRPEAGQLVAMDSRRRLFDDNLRRFIVLRDQRCRTPWCDAPIRHADHAQPAARGGLTSADNGDGLSEDCNYTREASGWYVSGRGGDTLTITTPTGHTYASSPPALHRPRHRQRRPSTGSG